jgi:hypothetical protein
VNQLTLRLSIESKGTKITKELLIEAIRKSPLKDYSFSKEQGVIHAVVKVVLD